MAMLTHDIPILQDVFTLHPYGAMFWRSKGWLLLSDLHLGKAAHFRKAGLPLPEGSDEQTLARLDELITHFNPQRVVIIGDLFHSDLNNGWKLFHDWCERQQVELHLVMGNHDRLSERRYRDAGLVTHAAGLVALPFILEHEAPLAMGGAGMIHVISGHTHPGVVLHGAGKQSLRLPCFLVGPQVTLLPAFGITTGLHIVKPTALHRVFACTEKAVLDVTGVSVEA
jgi:DNA ligase-associated metallophosphoesterase